MPGLIVWKNQRINELKRDMDRIFEKFSGEFGLDSTKGRIRGAPSIDLTETENKLILRAEVPGVKASDLEIDIVDDLLTIRGEKKQEIDKNDEDYRWAERRYGLFSRTIKLPCRITVKEVEASYKKGILEISMPKCPPETRTIKIGLK
jgi:HSP20 family protein